jgi:hypothetical protein
VGELLRIRIRTSRVLSRGLAGRGALLSRLAEALLSLTAGQTVGQHGLPLGRRDTGVGGRHSSDWLGLRIVSGESRNKTERRRTRAYPFVLPGRSLEVVSRHFGGRQARERSGVYIPLLLPSHGAIAGTLRRDVRLLSGTVGRDGRVGPGIAHPRTYLRGRVGLPARAHCPYPGDTG